MMDFRLAKKRDDLPSLDWWLEPAREETPGIGLDESLKQLASRFEAIAPEEDKKPLLVLVEPSRTEGKKYIPGPQDVISEHSRVSIVWGDLPDMQSELKLWIPEHLEHLISPSKENLSRSDGIA